MQSTRISLAESLTMMLEQAKSEKPYDLVILDAGEQGSQVGEMVEGIKKYYGIAEIKIIILTTYDVKGAKSAIDHGNIDGYVVKPVKQSQLFDGIAAVMGKKLQVSLSPSETEEAVVFPMLPKDKSLRTIAILLAEDNKANQKLAMLLLRKLDYQVDLAENGLEALAAVQQNHYDLILMDCQMPEMDGFGATIAIRQAEITTGKHIPIIAMTANAMQGDREKCLSIGMDDYISKPINPKQLKKIIERWSILR